MGDWSTPLVRQETKWRYKLYKKWLSLLDEGFGDAFEQGEGDGGDVYGSPPAQWGAVELVEGDDDDDDKDEQACSIAGMRQIVKGLAPG